MISVKVLMKVGCLFKMYGLPVRMLSQCPPPDSITELSAGYPSCTEALEERSSLSSN